ncbi:transposase [Streptomyces sp. NPDC127178]|uniref:transposase n=1 Tax=unclassified Streptomyces TaxID=2593676 RepID=UPI0036392186
MEKRQARPWIVSDELWSLIEPLLPEPPPHLAARRPRVIDRQALSGILFALQAGVPGSTRPRSSASARG